MGDLGREDVRRGISTLAGLVRSGCSDLPVDTWSAMRVRIMGRHLHLSAVQRSWRVSGFSCNPPQPNASQQKVTAGLSCGRPFIETRGAPPNLVHHVRDVWHTLIQIHRLSQCHQRGERRTEAPVGRGPAVLRARSALGPCTVHLVRMLCASHRVHDICPSQPDSELLRSTWSHVPLEGWWALGALTCQRGWTRWDGPIRTPPQMGQSKTDCRPHERQSNRTHFLRSPPLGPQHRSRWVLPHPV